MRRAALALLLALTPMAAHALPEAASGTFVIRDFVFADGERLPELRIAYRTLGTPHRNAAGEIDNAVLLMHGTGANSDAFLAPGFADPLFGPGKPLDAARWFIILPDAIGHGGSSKPSDGLRMRFPRYDYADMVEANRRLAAEHLGIRTLRLVMGTSMGGKHRRRPARPPTRNSPSPSRRCCKAATPMISSMRSMPRGPTIPGSHSRRSRRRCCGSISRTIRSIR
jgi:homoserine O-acetyltransferase